MIKLDIPTITENSPSLVAEKTVSALPENFTSLQIDVSAVNRLRILQQKQKNPELKLRIRIRGGGCSGFQYKFELTKNVEDDDQIFTKDGCEFIVDALSLAMLEGARLEYFMSPIESGFRLDNPQAKSNCGCGISFSIG